MSFIEHLQIILERKDIKFSENILKMTKKIISFIKKNKKRLFSVAHYKPGNGYYLSYKTIDPKSEIEDLYIALLHVNQSETLSNISNPAALAKMKDKETGQFYYILRLYIFDSQEDMEKNVSLVINKIFDSPKWNSNIYHELTHYIDEKRQKVNYSYHIKDYLNDKEVKDILEKLKKYYNLDDEINAYFVQSATMFWNSIKNKRIDFLNLPFNSFKEAFIYFYGTNAFETLTLDNKKRILKRIYLLYTDFKEKVQKK
jgi:hypothetical protein